jgi:hypothetical protein
MPPAEQIGPSAGDDRFTVALPTVAERLALDATDARPLRRHDSGIFALPRSNVVVRLSAATTVNRARAELALRVTGWLHRLGFPTVEPVHDILCEAGGAVATVWRYLPQPSDPAPPLARARALGSLLRELHAEAGPPLPVPILDPFARLRAAIVADNERAQPVLPATDRAFLTGRIAELADAYAGLDFPLGIGLIHNDAHIGNLLVSADISGGFVLADWESESRAPGGGPGPRGCSGQPVRGIGRVEGSVRPRVRIRHRGLGWVARTA